MCKVAVIFTQKRTVLYINKDKVVGVVEVKFMKFQQNFALKEFIFEIVLLYISVEKKSLHDDSLFDNCEKLKTYFSLLKQNLR